MKKVITAIVLTALCVNLFGCASSTPEASITSSNNTESISASNTSIDADSVEENDNNDDNIHITEKDKWVLHLSYDFDAHKYVAFPLDDEVMFKSSKGMDSYSDYSDNRNIVSVNGEYGMLIKTWVKQGENYSIKLNDIIDKPNVSNHITTDNAFDKIMKDCTPYDASFVKESEEKVTIGNKECMKYIGTIQLDADKGMFYAECYTFFVDSTPCYILSVMLNDIKIDKGDKAAMEEKINYIIASAYSQN